MKAVMYHYVREDSVDYPFFKHLNIEDFEKQLDYFDNEFGFVDQNDFVSAFSSKRDLSGVVLTFDDGVLDHYKYVYPALKRRGLWGIFYVPAFIFSGRILDVHRIHLLLGRFESANLMQRLNDLIRPEMLTDIGRKEFTRDTYARQDNDEATVAFKRTLNYTIGYQHRTTVIDSLMHDFFGADADFSDFYASPKMLQTMQDDGMIIGSHSVNHPVMSKLSFDDQRKEIEESFRMLEQHIGIPSVKSFCYPYGGFHSFTPDTEQILSENNCLFSFNVEPRDIALSDISQRPQALPRYDCNAFPFGKCR